MKTYLFRVVVEPDDDRGVTYCPALADKGGATWGFTRDEAVKNIHDVIRMTVEGMLAHGEPIPEALPGDANARDEAMVAVMV